MRATTVLAVAAAAMVLACGPPLQRAGALPHNDDDTSKCGPDDNADDCDALYDFGTAMGYQKWEKNTKWLEAGKSVCLWHGITCSGGRVTGMDLKENNLVGSVPASISKLEKLQTFYISGTRPASYQGCENTNLGNTSLPDSFWTLTDLTNTGWEYTCMSGTIPASVAQMTNLQEASWHGNQLSGSLPPAWPDSMLIMKLGRNPLSGTVPEYRNLAKLQKFNCNFCSLTGTFPDVFGYMPALQQSFWDGNGFHGSLPPSLGKASNLQVMSFNINNFTGDVPPGLCDLSALHDCRIGGDTNLDPYQAHYPWIQPVVGNVYSCATLPKCAGVGGICNSTHDAGKDQDNSPVRCV